MQLFSAADAKAVSGATQRQLDYWDDQEIVPASVGHRAGKGKDRRYSFDDLLKLCMVVTLRQAGVSLQKIRKAITRLERVGFKGSALARKKVVTDGSDILVTTSDPRILRSVLKNGQLAFSVFLVGDIIREAKELIRLHVQYASAQATAALKAS